MCVLALAWRASARWRLVMAGNRDERHDRPAAPLARWKQPDHLVAGRDLQSGGTWLGVSDHGRFAVVTNLPAERPPEPGAPSRGELVSDCLLGRMGAGPSDLARLSRFSPFNLIAVNKDQAWFLSNRPKPTRKALAPGLYGLSNAGLDEPWPKTLRLKAGVESWLGSRSAPIDSLLDILADEQSGIPDWHRSERDSAGSPIFIRNPVYGTRCSTVVAIDQDGEGLIVERSFDSNGERSGEAEVRFSWPR